MKRNGMTNDSKSAFIAIIGRPNVGKSTLLNQLVGEKVAIVSDKPQTTRNRILGIKTIEETQFVFFDTPGVHRPKTRLGDFMVKSIGGAVSGVDAAIYVTQTGSKINQEDRNLLEQCRRQKLPVVLAINKTDTIKDKSALLLMIAEWTDIYSFEAVVPMSALTGDGIQELTAETSKFASEGPHYFPDDMISDQPERVIAAELVREKILLSLREEVPHGVAVVVESIKERQSGDKVILDIEANIFCERESHKAILIGKKGAMLRRIGEAARIEMESLFDTKVNLQCWIKVKEDWRNRQGFLNGFGYN
ncbi:MAG: GTPase Era [Oscillospiraceae bacterium]|nr:GTPase Era [Oscillospiraceae bacterium]MDD3832384.1 GTPase Era [Oscillospiraceae bacterium]